MKMSRELKIEIAIHTACWLLVLAIPFVFVEQSADGLTFNWFRYGHHCVMISACAIVVYINYLYLLPKILFQRKRTALFWVVNVILIVSLALSLTIAFSPNAGHRFVRPLMPQTELDEELPPTELDEELPPPRPRPRPRPTYLPQQALFFMRDLSFLCLAFCIGFAVKLALQYRRKELHYQQIERLQLETELMQLRYQVNPHFLLNTLNNIYALIAIDAAKAQKSILELSKMLRYVLYDSQEYVPLPHEVQFLRNYIALMRLRLSDTVTVQADFDVDDDTPTLVAPMLFISLVENAFKHGISPKGKCAISIVLRDDNGCITCRVVNGNYPKTDADKSGSGVGLAHLRRRLNLIYPDRYVWNISLSADQKEYISELTINTKA